MSKNREDMVALRDRIMLGDPPYEIDPTTGAKKRKTGTPGLDELKSVGAYDAGAAVAIMQMEAIREIIDHILGRMK